MCAGRAEAEELEAAEEGRDFRRIIVRDGAWPWRFVVVAVIAGEVIGTGFLAREEKMPSAALLVPPLDDGCSCSEGCIVSVSMVPLLFVQLK